MWRKYTTGSLSGWRRIKVRVEDLISACRHAIDNHDMSLGYIRLVLPFSRFQGEACSRTVRLIPEGGPICDVVGEVSSGVVVFAPAMELLKWLEENKEKDGES
jgi:hypothetical protein